jgi:hypothetical protein
MSICISAPKARIRQEIFKKCEGMGPGVAA